jgi:hypothetical protein
MYIIKQLSTIISSYNNEIIFDNYRAVLRSGCRRSSLANQRTIPFIGFGIKYINIIVIFIGPTFTTGATENNG